MNWEHKIQWMVTSNFRTETIVDLNWREITEQGQFPNAEQYREAVSSLLERGYIDDRPWIDSDYRGQGNRWKRRAGWRLKAGSCMHSGWEYDCCCEPRSYYSNR